MRAITILTGAMLIAISHPSRALPPTAPLKNMKADDIELEEPECSVNSTFGETYSKNGLISKRYRWEDFKVHPDPSFNDEERRKIKEAMSNLQKVLPCIKFHISKKGAGKPSGDYVHIKKGHGCHSELGRRRTGAQELSLEAPGCWKIGIIMHEMIHALGFDHEHNRPDRDEHINIIWDNIKSGERDQFEKGKKNEFTSFGVHYNVKSIMHYGSWSFSKNKNPTITDKSGGTFQANRAALEETDKQKLKKMYNCE